LNSYLNLPISSSKQSGEFPVSETISIPVAQLQQLQGRLATLEANQAAEASARQAAEASAAIARGESAAVVRSYQEKLQAAEQEARTSAATADLRKALAAHPLRDSYAIEHVTSLLADEITSDRDSSGRLTTRSKDFRPIDAFVTEKLSSPQYAHFLAPRNPSAPAGQPQSGTAPLAARAIPEDDPNAALGVRIMNHALRAMEAKKADAVANDPRTNMSVTFGLGRKR
jgi:hypothetical protein